MLFDGTQHRILTRIVAWIAIAAFLGFGLVAGGLAVGGGCANMDPSQQAVDAARTTLADAQATYVKAQAAQKAKSKDRAAREAAAVARIAVGQAQANLATALVTLDAKDPKALEAAQAAVKDAPGDIDTVMSLASVARTQGQIAASLPAFAAYTAKNPKDAQAYVYWGQTADEAGQVQQAILAYQRFLDLAPDDTLASDVKARLKELTKR